MGNPNPNPNLAERRLRLRLTSEAALLVEALLLGGTLPLLEFSIAA